LGHRWIGFLNYPPAGASFMPQGDYGPAVRAREAYEQALQKHGLAPIYRQVDFAEQDVTKTTLEILEEQPNLTAIFIADGARTVGVIRALHQQGREVPDDVSVVGIATDRLAELVMPPLTANSFPSHAMGYRAVKMLISKLRQESLETEQVLIPPKLIVRKSTGPARGD
jgi:DNA-binding LacI/PurR family transcriptional regulator